MANEVTVTSRVQWSKSGVTIANATYTDTITVESTLTKASSSVVSIGTTVEAVDTGDVTVTKQYGLRFTNLDATNFVTVYVRYDVSPTDVVAGIMLPGETFGPVRAGAQSGGYPAYWLKADTAACDVEVECYDLGDPTA